MSELVDKIWVEKYRPRVFDDLILDNKTEILKHMQNPKSLPSFIFYSSKPGTGKTSLAKLMVETLDADCQPINSSDERGIETIRSKVRNFAISKSSNDKTKRCIFMDEADGLTSIAQDSLRNLMEEYSDNCFFILTCNRLSKIIEPLQSRCFVVNFEKPERTEIFMRLEHICKEEKLDCSDEDLLGIINFYYPDIRSMVKYLHKCKILGQKPSITNINEEYMEFLSKLKEKDVKYIYLKAYDSSFDIDNFVIWFFQYIFENGTAGIDKYTRIVNCLADYEKSAMLGVNREIVFVSNMLEIMKVI